MSKNYVGHNEYEGIYKYFKEIRKYEIITPEKEVELTNRIKSGDSSAIDELVYGNLKFVVSIAKMYQGQGLPLSDLINEGNYGLIKAAIRFDHTRGFRFISYAVHWVKQAIKLSLNDNSKSIRLPANVVNKLYKSRKQINRFEMINGREPVNGDKVLIKNGGFEVYEEPPIPPSCGSLNEVVKDFELIDCVADENSLIPGEEEVKEDVINDALYKTLDILNERERSVIEFYFGLNGGDVMTLDSIGSKYGLTKERIRQIKEKAIRKLRYNAHNLYDVINR